MDIRLRVEELLKKYASASLEKRGLFRKIEEWSRKQPPSPPRKKPIVLERHKVSRIFRNEEPSVTVELLGVLCDYLVKVCGVPEHRLPEELFGTTEHHLLDLFAKTTRVQFFLGMRLSDEWGPNKYVMAADAAFQSTLTTLVTRYLSTRREKLLEQIDTILVDAPPRDIRPETKSDHWGRIKDAAAVKFRKFQKLSDSAMVLTGSMKVNPLVEQFFSSLFQEQPHQTVEARTPAERKVPLFVRYRNQDPQPASCLAGLELSEEVGSPTPGVYFECEDGGWRCVPCDENLDVAVVAYVRHAKRNQLAVACSGFSSNATHYFRQILDKAVDQFWPPQIKTPDFMLGMFVIQFTPKQSAKELTGGELTELGKDEYKVVRMDDAVIQRRSIRWPGYTHKPGRRAPPIASG